MPQILSVTNLSKTFGTRPVIKELSFSIEQGERVTLFAPSGSGKSTLINILSRVDPQFSGSFHLAAGLPSTIFQEPRIFPYMTIRENIFFPLRVRRLPLSAGLLDEYAAWLDVCGLREHSEHYPYQISGGMKQKVSLIRSFLMRPDFVMMDEPFKSIDLSSKNRIIRHILRHYPDITLLLVTHNVEEIPLLTKSLLVFTRNVLAEYSKSPDISNFSLAEIFARLFSDVELSA